MECNKDEAMRAKEIAEKKMHANDFDGARRIALKAQHLFPELENISQLLTVCNVHCSAEKRILGSEKDWYGILQVDRLADEATIKKQYRKLALVLHPDKNKFPGAEAAFKIIGEAHVVLSDHGKRSLYDSKVGIALKPAQAKPPFYKVNMNPPARKQSAVQNNTANGFSSHFSGLNHHQATQKSTGGQEAFWTCCPYCKIKYQFYRDVQNRMLRCQKCTKPYVAYEVTAQGVPGSNQSQAAAQGVPPTFNRCQPAASKLVDDAIQGTNRTCGRRTGGLMPSNLDSQANAGSGSVGSFSGTEVRSTAKVGLDKKTKDVKKEGAAMPKDVKVPYEEADLRNRSRKRQRKSESESSESCDMSSSSIMEDVTIENSGSGPAAGISSGVNATEFVRRSCRQKHQVSYNESGTDDDFESPPKRSRKGNSSSYGEGHPEGTVNDNLNFANSMEQKENVPSPGTSAKGNTKICKDQTTEQAAHAQNRASGKSEVIDVDVSESEEEFNVPVPEFNVPDPEFNDFDKVNEGSFAVDQFWACYDDDGLPRYYAHIRKVCLTPFKLHFTWLEADPDDEGEIDWARGGLPVGCGKFQHGDSKDETNLRTFSHQMVCKKGKRKGTFMVYPRRGETWALFKDWDIRWSVNPGRHKQLKYEIVVILSDFMKGAGVEVAFLERLHGFVSLFQRSQNRADSVLIPATEMFRFSHCIPSFKMSGTEKGVPEGSFELDPACLPANSDDICYPSVTDTDVKTMRAEADCSIRDSIKINKPRLSESKNTPKEPVDLVRENGVGGDRCKLRRSPRRLNSVGNNAYDSSTGMETSDHINGKESKSEYSPLKADVPTCQADKRIDIQMQDSRPSKNNSFNHSLSSGCKASEDLLHDFEEDRSEGKFKQCQIWALYVPEHNLPKMYGQIKKIEQSPFRLHVAPLESISPSNDGRQSVCGIFRVKNGKPRAFEPSSFSHQLEATFYGKNCIEIYPKVGEVWALYRNWNAELTSSDLKNCECELVEIVGVSNGCTKVSPLVPSSRRHNRYIFRSPRRQRSGPETIGIQGNELARFSHQIPAFLLSAEEGGSLEGCWQVDAAAVPRSLLRAK